MDTYKTIQGDTFDLISKKIYGNESYFIKLIEANQEYVNTVIFPSGIVLNIPDIDTQTEASKTTAPWR